MASMTVRNLDEDVKRRFVEKARRRGTSAEALLREVVLRAAFADDEEANRSRLEGLLDRIECEAADMPQDAQQAIDEARVAAEQWRTTEQLP
jgi:plasmid stability protein